MILARCCTISTRGCIGVVPVNCLPILSRACHTCCIWGEAEHTLPMCKVCHSDGGAQSACASQPFSEPSPAARHWALLDLGCWRETDSITCWRKCPHCTFCWWWGRLVHAVLALWVVAQGALEQWPVTPWAGHLLTLSLCERIPTAGHSPFMSCVGHCSLSCQL